MKKIFVLLLFSILVLSCKENVLIPPEEKLKDPREMTWTADTLQTPEGAIQLLPQNLLVFSTNDAWLCCWSDVINGLIWHYDGKNWIHSSTLEELGGFRVRDIAGKSSQDLWTAGYSGENVFMAYYKGTKWERYYPNIKGDILDMATDASGSIWACGRNGLIMRCSNNKWITDTIKVGYSQIHSDAEYFLRSVEYYNNRMYLIAWVIDNNRKKNIYYYIKGDIKAWEIIDSMIVDSPSNTIEWGNWSLFKNSNGDLYSCGLYGVWRYENTSWKKECDFDGEIYQVSGTSSRYMFAVSAYKTVLFYDGNRWQSISDLFKVNDTIFVFRNVWTNGQEVIIVGYGYISGKQKTIIWRGK